ncbi:chaperonin 10-like protein [Aspergillus aurantiobrunneus]
MPSQHEAAIIPQLGGPLILGQRDTPEPGPNDVLIEVKAVALNPCDHFQRDYGMPPVPIYPAVLGSDTAGVVTKLGSNVTSVLGPGSRVIAFASSFYQNGSPDHGSFQKSTLAQSEAVIPLPDHLSFEEGAVFPLAALTALTAWTTIGIPLDTRYTPDDKQAVLIWGASSSVGSIAVQSAKTLGFTVYATASPKHHALVTKLGADAVFDYRADDVVAQIVGAVHRDGVRLHTAHCVVDGALQPTLDILKETKGDNPAKVAHSPVLPEGYPTLDNTQVTFNFPSMDEVARSKHIKEVFHGWLSPGLQAGEVVPSPNIQVEGGGLGGVHAALDKLKGGVSGTKIVVPL